MVLKRGSEVWIIMRLCVRYVKIFLESKQVVCALESKWPYLASPDILSHHENYCSFRAQGTSYTKPYRLKKVET